MRMRIREKEIQAFGFNTICLHAETKTFERKKVSRVVTHSFMQYLSYLMKTPQTTTRMMTRPSWFCILCLRIDMIRKRK